MGKYRLDEEELLNAKVLLGHVNRKLENANVLLENAYHGVEGQSGFGIEEKKHDIRGKCDEINHVRNIIDLMQVFIQDAIDLTKVASENAKNMMGNGVVEEKQSSASEVSKDEGISIIDEKAACIERMKSISLIKNSTANGDPGFIEKGCVITTIANLYRRKVSLENFNVDITRETVRSANNENILMNWDVTSQNMQNISGYPMKYEEGAVASEHIEQLLYENPEGVFVFANGRYLPKDDAYYTHAIVITEKDDNGYLVVDPIDGVIKYWTECYSVSNPSGAFYGWSIAHFFENALRMGYIPE